jgi:hypothetical protein
MRFTPMTPAHQMYACGMHALEVQINHKRPYTGGRDLSCKIRVFALRNKRSLWAAAHRVFTEIVYLPNARYPESL